ncbi:MAG: glutamate synthase [Planctomycetes bacterium RBG_16_64_12]|nr:MAG: glutamate synthase [Planctomycetes bacterium RBG_16_64_12]
MVNPTGFVDYQRIEVDHRPIQERIGDWKEIDLPMREQVLREQAARCMDCGIPFCHGVGCPVINRIPEFNDLVYQDRWREAAENLHSTNNFPEITGRVCPAPCEAACTLALNDKAVNIKHVEYQIAERAFAEGWVKPLRAAAKTRKKVAVVGSGPAGLAAAQQCARAGHQVVVFERDDRIGGLLRYGIPDFKLDKQILDRRLEQMIAEGVVFEPGVNVGGDLSARYLEQTFDAILLAMGAGRPRPLEVPGAELGGVHFAMDYLSEQNRRLAGDPNAAAGEAISACDKHVIVIGGGDTGSDCVGTAIRQGARSVTQLEILPQPPEGANAKTPWPAWPLILRTSTSQKEGCRRRFSVLTKSLTGSGGRVSRLHGCEVQWIDGPRGPQMKERPGTDFTLDADLVLLAMGFLHVVHEGLARDLDLKLDAGGNIAVQRWMTSRQGIFAAGDAVQGASLVVRAIHQGRLAAAAADQWLRKKG